MCLRYEALQLQTAHFFFFKENEFHAFFTLTTFDTLETEGQEENDERMWPLPNKSCDHNINTRPIPFPTRKCNV